MWARVSSFLACIIMRTVSYTSYAPHTSPLKTPWDVLLPGPASYTCGRHIAICIEFNTSSIIT